VGIKAFRDAVNQMSAAITKPDAALSSSITAAQATAQSLQSGGEGVLTAAVRSQIFQPTYFFTY
jgi:hypothetical protein